MFECFTNRNMFVDPLKDPKICGRPQCDLETSKFAYKQLVKYKYNYRSHVRTEFHGTGQNTSDIFVTAAVQLTFPTKCEGAMVVSEIELRNAPLPDSNEESDDGNSSDDFNTDDPFADLHQKSSDFAYEIQKHEIKYFSHHVQHRTQCALCLIGEFYSFLSIDLPSMTVSLAKCVPM